MKCNDSILDADHYSKSNGKRSSKMVSYLKPTSDRLTYHSLISVLLSFCTVQTQQNYFAGDSISVILSTTIVSHCLPQSLGLSATCCWNFHLQNTTQSLDSAIHKYHSQYWTSVCSTADLYNLSQNSFGHSIEQFFKESRR